MSLLQYLQPSDDHAFVMVDTRHSLGGEISKMLPVPHLGAIVAARGRTAVLLGVFSSLLGCGSFDVAAERFEAIVRDVLDEFRCLNVTLDASIPDASQIRARANERFGGQLELDADEVLLAGWSERACSVEAVYVRSTAGGASISTKRGLGALAGPEFPGFNAAAGQVVAQGTLSDGQALQFVRAQLAHAVSVAPLAVQCLGGQMLLGRVSRAEVSVRNLGNL